MQGKEVFVSTLNYHHEHLHFLHAADDDNKLGWKGKMCVKRYLTRYMCNYSMKQE